jgi:hypothetical protein
MASRIRLPGVQKSSSIVILYESVHLNPVLIVNVSVPREGVMVAKNHATRLRKFLYLL